jgi:hypothetical protein
MDRSVKIKQFGQTNVIQLIDRQVMKKTQLELIPNEKN